MKLLILFLSLILATSSFAKKDNDNGKGHGNKVKKFKPTINIIPDIVSDYVVQAGEKAQFKGTICLLKQHPVKEDKPSCQRLEEDQQFSQYKVKFFYPDANSEVTSSVAITQDDSGIHYNYLTEEISSVNLNRLSVVVVKEDAKIDAILHLQAKIDRFLALISKHQDTGKSLDALTKILTRLKGKLEDRLQKDPALLSRLDYPVQVENHIAPPVEYQSIVSNMKLAMKLEHGSVIAGEKAKISAKVTNIDEKDGVIDHIFDHEEYFKRKWRYRAQFLWMGEVVHESEEKLLTSGDMFSYEFVTDKLSPGDLGKFEVKVLRSKEVPTHAASYNMLQNQGWGHISYTLPVVTDAIAPVWSSESVISEMQYYQNYPVLKYEVRDALGRIDRDSLVATINGEALTGFTFEALGESLLLQNGAANYQISKDINPLSEGVYTIHAAISDLAGNSAIPNPNTRQFRIDRTAPALAVNLPDSILTNNPSLIVPINVVDESPVMVEVYHNGQKVATESVTETNVSVELVEGLNSILVSVVDAAGNEGVSYENNNITLDTIPPVLSDISPHNNEVVRRLSFSASGKTNEPLSSVKIDGVDAQLSSDSFSLDIIKSQEGRFVLEVEATDLAGNVTTETIDYEIVTQLIIAELITIVPKDNKLHVIGMPGAAYHGAELNFSTSFWGGYEFYPNEDGSFSIVSNYFESADLSANAPDLDRYQNVRLNYQSDTTFSGVVRDYQDNPIPGVKVSIVNSGQVTLTDANGVFKINQPELGDQEILFDGTEVPEAYTNNQKLFGTVKINVSLGLLQTNVLEDPVYMVPTLMDGTQTEVSNEETTIVESPHAPGVRLEIPAGVTQFPAGFQANAINMIEIAADKTSVPLIEAAQPDTVVALEPSGVRFTERVKLVLPNPNNFPVGMEMVILSKNNESGLWEPDGAAIVTENNTIETKEGQGISHFSELYASPFGMRMSELKDSENLSPSISTDFGDLVRSVSLPSFKINGQDIQPNLVYKASWANPSALVSTVLDMPGDRYFEFSSSNTMGGFSGSVRVKTKTLGWQKPLWIKSQFFIGDIETPELTFNSENAPQRAIVSYKQSLNTLDSGLYPARATYKIRWHNFLMTSNKIRKRDGFWGGIKTTPKKIIIQDVIEDIFPPDLESLVYLQNKKSSEVGRGWKLGVTQEILNPDSNRLVVESEGGQLDTYVLDNTVETLYYNDNGIKSVNFDDYPNLLLGIENDEIIEADVSSNSEAKLFDSVPVTGTLGVNTGYETTQKVTLPWGPTYRTWKINQCKRYYIPFEISRLPDFFLDTPHGLLGVARSGFVVKYDSEQVNLLGRTKTPATFEKHERYLRQEPSFSSFCVQQTGSACQSASSINAFKTLQEGNFFDSMDNECDLSTSDFRCYQGNCTKNRRTSSGGIADKGYVDGAFGSVKVNTPMMIIPSNTYGEYIFADFGNNIIRKINMETGTVSAFAGNRSTNDTGDGGQAINAGIFHPRGLARDSLGNIYVTTERGLIRKIDTSGVITTFAGKDGVGNAQDVSTIDELVLKDPTGMAIDEENGFIYVADTGNNRIVRIDPQNDLAINVFGKGTCDKGVENIKDGEPALNVSICRPEHIGLDGSGNLLVLDKENDRIRRVNFNKSSDGSLKYKTIANDNSVIIKNRDGSFDRINRNGAKVTFNSLGRQIASSDKVGNISTFSYDGEGNLVEVVLPKNKKITLSYINGKLDSILDPANRQTQFEYQGSDLIAVIYPDGTRKRFDYATTGEMVSEFDQRGYETKYQYSIYARLEKVITPDGNSKVIAEGIADTIGNSYTGEEQKEVKNYEEDNELANILKDAKGYETKFSIDRTGLISEVTDAKDRKVLIERDLKARPTKITRFDDLGNEISHTTFTYNEYGDLVHKYDSETDNSESFEYNSEGNLTKYTNTLEHTKTNVYDLDQNGEGTGLLLKEIDFNGNAITRTYFDDGLVQTVTNDKNETTQFKYDLLGNLEEKISPQGEKIIYTRDTAGNILSKTNAEGISTHYTYDDFNRLTSVTTGVTDSDPVGKTTAYAYTATGQLESITDPQGNTTSFIYDALDRLVKKTTPLGQVTELSYDPNNNVNWEKDPNGNERSFEYDSDNMLTKKILADNIYQMNYDIHGNMTNISDSDSEIEFTYEKIDKDYYVSSTSTSGEEMPDATLSYEYDALGNRKVMETFWGDFTYDYDASNRLITLTNHKNESFDFDYDEANRLTQITRPGSVTKFTFDKNSFVTNIAHNKVNNDVISFFNYTRDAIGNRTSITSGRGIASYGYDAESQLTLVSNTELSGDYASESFSYDSLGNRLNDQLGSYSYDQKSQRLMEDYKYSYSYDENGNMTSRQEKGLTGNFTNYDYSSENQLVKISIYQNNNLVKEIDYFYDALGRRMRKVIVDHQNSLNSFERKYIYDGQEILAELDENNNELGIYTHSTLRTDDVLAVDVRSNKLASSVGSYFYLKDALGSVVEVVDGAGQVVQHYVYSSYGKLLEIKGNDGADLSSAPLISTSYGFTGRELDQESGMMYYRARYYMPEIGRFLQEDPHPGDIRSPITLINKYSYAGNNPIMNVDPDGEFFFTAIFFGMIAGGLIAGFTGGDVAEGMFLGAVITAAVISGAAVGATAGSAAGSFATGALGTGFWGSLAASAISYSAAFLAGAATGAVVGGLTGGVANLYLGRGSFEEGLVEGAGVGYVAGGIAGAVNFGFADSTTLFVNEGSTFGKFLTSKAGLSTIVGTGAFLPLGTFKVEYSSQN